MSLFALSKGSEKHRSTEERQASAVGSRTEDDRRCAKGSMGEG